MVQQLHKDKENLRKGLQGANTILRVGRRTEVAERGAGGSGWAGARSVGGGCVRRHRQAAWLSGKSGGQCIVRGPLHHSSVSHLDPPASQLSAVVAVQVGHVCLSVDSPPLRPAVSLAFSFIFQSTITNL